MFTRLPPRHAGSAGRSSLIHISIMGTSSSSAHLISQSSPSALQVFFEISAITPSQPFTRARQFVFQFVSQGSFTDISTKSNGVFGCLAWPTRKSRYVLSWIANAIKTRFPAMLTSSRMVLRCDVLLVLRHEFHSHWLFDFLFRLERDPLFGAREELPRTAC